ncbi:MAG: hypothetical protein JWO56_274 [Acidobacteria bacterium]|nr:hypothetical protein [Acidobacteriota bacterium]
MTTTTKALETINTTKAFKQIDRAIRTLDLQAMEEEQGLLPETQTGRIERLVKLYSGVRPLLTAMTALPLIPAAWRAALAIFTQALEALAATVPNANPDFKAGKDL